MVISPKFLIRVGSAKFVAKVAIVGGRLACERFSSTPGQKQFVLVSGGGLEVSHSELSSPLSQDQKIKLLKQLLAPENVAAVYDAYYRDSAEDDATRYLAFARMFERHQHSTLKPSPPESDVVMSSKRQRSFSGSYREGDDDEQQADPAGDSPPEATIDLTA